MKLKNIPNTLKVWSNGKIIENPTPIDSLNFALHYGGPTVWEGIRSYKTHDNTVIWADKAHVQRLFDSAKILGITIPFTKGQILDGIRSVVEANGGGNLYIRPLAYLNQDAKTVRPDRKSQVNIDIYAFPFNPDVNKANAGIKVGISTYLRGYPQFQMQAKNAANYIFQTHCKHEMEALGVDDMLLTDNHGYITEATVANVFVIRGDTAFTPPNDGSILPGITRAVTINDLLHPSNTFVALHKNINVLEKKITRADLYTADEIFICGTYCEILPVVEVDKRLIGNGKPGFYTKYVREAYHKLILGG